MPSDHMCGTCRNYEACDSLPDESCAAHSDSVRRKDKHIINLAEGGDPYLASEDADRCAGQVFTNEQEACLHEMLERAKREVLAEVRSIY